jgi:alpha-tubulin suppressor-like RCC1 family protein
VLLLCGALAGLGVVFSDASFAGGTPGSVLAWGYNDYGQLGVGPIVASPACEHLFCSSTPVAALAGEIPAGTTVAQVAVGADHSLAVSSAGELYAWGRNVHGELGDGGAQEQAEVPVAVSAGAIPSGTTFTEVAAGNEFSVALSSTGKLYAWGLNSFGQLGDGGTTLSKVPVAVSAGAIAGATIAQIAAGETFSLALSSSGHLYAWGDNGSGQLGDGGAQAQAEAPVAVDPGTTFTQIAAGDADGLALSSTGELYAWGFNQYGQLGDGTTSESNVPTAVSAGAIPGGTTIAAIAAGYGHDLVASSTGQMYAWGDDRAGELGAVSIANVPSCKPCSVTPAAVSAGAIPAGTTIAQLSAGNSFSLALSSSGLVYEWGEGKYGVLGDGSTENLGAPGAVSLPSGTTISALARGAASSSVLAIVGGQAGTGPGTTSESTGTTGSTATSSPSPPSGSGGTPGIASTPQAIEEVLLGCSKSKLVLSDVLIRGGRVALSGSAAASLAGKKVEILFNERKRVASATVGKDGQFSTTAPLPPAKIRDSLSTRYRAVLGGLRSLNLKLVRRLQLEPPRASGTVVTLSGQIVPPLTKPIAPVLVEQQLECGVTTIAKTFTPSASGRFHITLTVPAGARAGLYRLRSKVAANAHANREGFSTYSLPLPVALG